VLVECQDTIHGDLPVLVRVGAQDYVEKGIPRVRKISIASRNSRVSKVSKDKRVSRASRIKSAG
jgi:hypothetical protein